MREFLKYFEIAAGFLSHKNCKHSGDVDNLIDDNF